jgi:rRNA maturation endonuclease Nob1
MSGLRRLKALITWTDRDSEATYECLACHAKFQYRHQVCPECGGFDIRSTEWLGGVDDTPPDQDG